MKNILVILLAVFGFTMFQSCAQTNHEHNTVIHQSNPMQEVDYSKYSNAYFASGCFWCAEAVFESVVGVVEVISGYSGGEKENATYEKIGSGRTDHAESIRVIYDSTVVSYATLLDVFFGSHDPTTLNRQGPDRGPQYRSVIFYQNENEKQMVIRSMTRLNESEEFSNNIVTEVAMLDQFYPAEDYHQNYEKLHPNNGYVRSVSIPRLNKFKRKFPQLLKKDARLK